MGKNRMALEVLEKGLNRHPRLYSAVTLKGRALKALGRTEEARELLTGLLKSDPENLVAAKLLAEIPPVSNSVQTLAEPYQEITESSEQAPLQTDNLTPTAEPEAIIEEEEITLAQDEPAVEAPPFVEPEMEISAEIVALSPDEVTEEKEELEHVENAKIETVPYEPEMVIEAEPVVLSPVEVTEEKEELELVEEEAAIKETPSEPEPEMEPTPPRDTKTVETLEKWLNNASRMMKG